MRPASVCVYVRIQQQPADRYTHCAAGKEHTNTHQATPRVLRHHVGGRAPEYPHTQNQLHDILA